MSGDDLEREVLDVGLDLRIVELVADEALHVEDGVDEVHRDLVLCSVTDETVSVGERDIRGPDEVARVVGDDLDTVELLDTDTRVGGSKIDSDSF